MQTKTLSSPPRRVIKPFKAVLFDMDGVLIDSEPFWRQAQIEVFASVGKTFTEQDCAETMGIRIDEVVAYRVPEADQVEVVGAIVERVVQLVTDKGRALPGVKELLSRVASLSIPCGLATSSRYRLLEATLRCLDLQDAFQIVHSAEEEQLGKPHPAVYLTAAKKLGYFPQDCLAIEDSVNGLLSAKSAQMTAVAVPDADHANDPRFAIADLRLNSLHEAIPVIEEYYCR